MFIRHLVLKVNLVDVRLNNRYNHTMGKAYTHI